MGKTWREDGIASRGVVAVASWNAYGRYWVHGLSFSIAQNIVSISWALYISIIALW